jgi:hypothetical protein
MNHIENNIPDSVDQIQPDNHQSGLMVQENSIATLFARLQPQDVEQFYQSYQLWSITSRIQAIQAEIQQVQQEKIANAELLEQYHLSPVAQAVLAQLQSHDVNDSDLLDQMLERGDSWLDHTIQLLEQCEHLDIIHGNYTEWCMHALEGAYDWIGSMHESEATDEPEEPAATTEVFDESTEQLLLQKLLSDEEEAIQPKASVEPAVAVSEEEPAAPGEPAADEAEEDAPNSETSGIIETTDREYDQADEPEDVEIQEEATISQVPVEDRDAIVEYVEDEQADPAVLTEAVDEKATPETLEQDIEQESEKREIQVENLSEAVNSTEIEDATSNSEEIPVETAIEDTTSNGEEILVEATAKGTIEPDFQAITSVADEEVSEATSIAPEGEEPPEHEAVVEITSGEVLEEVAGDDENDETTNSAESDADPTNDVDEFIYEPVAMLDHDIQDNLDLALAENLPTQEERSSDLPLPSTTTEIEPVEAESAHTLHMGGSDEDTIAIPAIHKTTSPTSRVTPLRATVDAETQPTMPTIVSDTITTPVQETPSIVEANTIPGLPAITPPAQAIAPSTTSLPDIYGETNKHAAIQQTPAPIWRESSDLNLSPLQTSSTLLPEPNQGFFRRLWFKFLAWLRGE